MKIDVTPNLSVENSDREVIAMVKKIKSAYAETILNFIDNEGPDCFFVLIDLTKQTEPTEGTLYFIQHFGKPGDRGYVAYILKEVFKNRKELDIVIQFLEQAPVKTHFIRGCSEMLKMLRFGASLSELLKQGILSVPPSHFN